MGVSIVIPVYNAEQSLQPLVDRLEPVLEKLGQPYEVILVDDGSRDASLERIRGLAAACPWIRAIALRRNYGQHNALLCGVRAARFELTVTMDDDLQHAPEEIPKLLEAVRDDVDLVYGVPREERHSFWRNAASVATKYAMQYAMGIPEARNVSAFRAFRTSLREAFQHYNGPYVSLDVLLSWGTTRIASVTVEASDRAFGDSNYTLLKLVTHALNMITGFSVLPLRLASALGFSFVLIGGILFLYVLLSLALFGRVTKGFTFLGCAITLFSGVQLFALGIAGEYLARMYFHLMGRPSYVMRRDLGDSTDD